MMKSDFLFVHAFCLTCFAGLVRAGAVSECPSSSWIQFRNGCYIFLPSVLLKNSLGIDKARELCRVSGAEILSINNQEENKFITETFEKEWAGSEEVFLGIFFDTDGNTFKWYDNSEVTFTNWTEEEVSGELLNTCAALHTQTGQWRKISCDNFTEMGTLCKARLSSRRNKTGTGENKALVTAMVVVLSMLVSIASIILAVQCKRGLLSFGTSSTLHPPANAVRFTDESRLVNAEEGEFCD